MYTRMYEKHRKSLNTYCHSEGISRILKDSSKHVDEKNIPSAARYARLQDF